MKAIERLLALQIGAHEPTDAQRASARFPAGPGKAERQEDDQHDGDLNARCVLLTKTVRDRSTVTPPAALPRLQGLDALRGVAVFSVALFHFSYYLSQTRNPAPRFVFIGGRYGVDLFFMISGFAIFMTLERSANTRNFAVARFARLYPAFWTALLLAILATWLDGHRVPGISTALANATMLPALFDAPFLDESYWTLGYELLFYCLAAAFFVKGGGKPEIACLGWLLISLITIAYAPSLMKVVAAPYSYLFVTGIMVYRLWKEPRNYSSLAVLLAAIFIADRLPYVPQEHVSGLLNALMIAAFAMALRFGTAIRLPRPVGYVLGYAGEISYALYLVHQLGITLLHVAARFNLSPDTSMLMALVAVILIASAINAWIERPAQKWIRNRYSRRVRPQVLTRAA